MLGRERVRLNLDDDTYSYNHSLSNQLIYLKVKKKKIRDMKIQIIAPEDLFYVVRFEKLIIYRESEKIYESFNESLNNMIRSRDEDIRRLAFNILTEKIAENVKERS